MTMLQTRFRNSTVLLRLMVLATAMGVGVTCAGQAHSSPISAFQTVVSNGDVIPGTNKNFNSYNQPSVNNAGLVVFRARSQGGQPGGQPATGIFTRDMSSPGNPINAVTTRGSVVPDPNNTGATFNEFPSFPRIDANSNMIATRGQSNPVLEYQIGTDQGTGEPITTRAGTSGIYTNPGGPLQTGMSSLGNVSNATYPSNPDLGYFQVPHTTPGTKFDQFPGSPSPTGGDTVVFKGNWTDPSTGSPETGVYFRNVLDNGGQSFVQLIADSETLIPGTNTNFGSTAPPSAADGKVVFLGVDNEDAPTKGGIYMATLDGSKDPNVASTLTSIVSIGQSVPGTGMSFSQLGEALSFDGHYVAYWGAWGTETRQVTVDCASIENHNTRAFCEAQDNGTTAGSGTPGDGLYTFDDAVNQGFFVTDVDTLETRLIAETGSDYLDFVYWNFSGKISGTTDEEDSEPARWRSTSFIASDGWNAAFNGTRTDGSTGLYLRFDDDLLTIAELGMDGALLDPLATGLPITSLSIERDGYRNGWLALNASMASADAGWAGIYVARVPEPGVLALTALGILNLVWLRRKHA